VKERTRRVIDCVYKNEEFVEGGGGGGQPLKLKASGSTRSPIIFGRSGLHILLLEKYLHREFTLSYIWEVLQHSLTGSNSTQSHLQP
jgi:hypothetical protein